MFASWKKRGTTAQPVKLSLEAMEDRSQPSHLNAGVGPVELPAKAAHGAHGIETAIGAPAPSRPFTGHGSGQFVNAEGGFTATGIATHLGAFTHEGTLLLAPTDDPLVFTISGDVVYEAANGDLLYARIEGMLNVQTGVASGTDTWLGGTGRFEDATGSASITAQLLPDGSFTFELDGGIRF